MTSEKQPYGLPFDEEEDFDTIKHTIEELRREVEEHNYRYYVADTPTIGDQEFDLLLKKLEQLEQQYPQFDDPNSPTKRVGGGLNSSFKTVAHRTPMLSLANSYNLADVEEFYTRCQQTLREEEEVTIAAEIKFDGVSISLIYQQGELVRAVTRGDGLKGDDVTDNIRTINSVPLKLRRSEEGIPHELEVRGEIVLPFAQFERLNAERTALGKPLFANPRNAASGTIKLLDARQVRHRRLDAFFYYLQSDEITEESHFQRLNILRSWGFQVSPYTQLCSSLECIKEFLYKWEKERHHLPFATDGAVLKVDRTSLQKRLGTTAKAPRWAIAYKYETEQATTKLLEVTYQVGRTGVITPVANFEPVLIAGTMVQRATLHNADFMQSLDLREGDTLRVEKGGEIIPKVLAVELGERQPEAKEIAFPTLCPDCATPLVRNSGEVAYYCPNRYGCPTQAKERIRHYASRKAADITIGPETIEALFQNGFIHAIPDLYTLTAQQVAQLDGFKERATSNLLTSIEQSKNRPFAAILFGLGIPYVGEGAAKLLAMAFPSIESLSQASIETLCQVNGIGEKTASAVVAYFTDEKNQELIARLKQVGVRLQQEHTAQEETAQESTMPLRGKAIVISGTFQHHSREEYEEIITQYGGKRTSSISKNTAFVLAGDAMGPSKREQAQKLGVELLSEEQFLALLGLSPKE